MIDSDIDSNRGPTQNDCKSPHGRPNKRKIFKGTPTKNDLSKNNNVNVGSDAKVQNLSPIQLNLLHQILLSNGQLLAQALWSLLVK